MSQTDLPKPRRGLFAYALMETLRRRFNDVPDHRRQASCDYSMSDTLMSEFAMFATKEPSMLAFEDHQRELHIEKPFKIDAVPSDTQMRDILDGIDMEPLNEAPADLFWELPRGKELKQWLFDGQYYLVAIDGSDWQAMHRTSPIWNTTKCISCSMPSRATISICLNKSLLKWMKTIVNKKRIKLLPLRKQSVPKRVALLVCLSTKRTRM